MKEKKLTYEQLENYYNSTVGLWAIDRRPQEVDLIWIIQNAFQLKEIGGIEKKLTLKPFNLEEAKAGKPVCTRDGRKARIICFDKKNDYYPIIALVETEGKEYIFQYTSNGEYLEGNENNSHSNLVMLPERKEGWVNVYNDTPIYDTKERAELGALTIRKRIATVKIEWEE